MGHVPMSGAGEADFDSTDPAAAARFLDDPHKLAQLRNVCEYLEDHPEVLVERQDLDFLRSFLETWGAIVPEPRMRKEAPPPGAGSRWFPSGVNAPGLQGRAVEEEQEEEDEEEEGQEKEADDERDPDCWPEDTFPFPPLAPPRQAQPSEAELYRQGEEKQRAQQAYEIGNFELALRHYSEAIAVGEASALLYTRRAETLLRLRRPLAAIEDCNAALDLNPDSGKAFRLRGIAFRYLGKWTQSHEDLAKGQSIDYDEATVPVQQLVDRRAAAIRERQQQRAQKSRRLEGVRRKRLAKWIYEAQERDELPVSFDTELLMSAVNEDPQLLKKLDEPKFRNALAELSRDPSCFAEVQSDPEVAQVMRPVMLAMVSGGMPHTQ